MAERKKQVTAPSPPKAVTSRQDEIVVKSSGIEISKANKVAKTLRDAGYVVRVGVPPKSSRSGKFIVHQDAQGPWTLVLDKDIAPATANSAVAHAFEHIVKRRVRPGAFRPIVEIDSLSKTFRDLRSTTKRHDAVLRGVGSVLNVGGVTIKRAVP
jgi:hypothetical protein